MKLTFVTYCSEDFEKYGLSISNQASLQFDDVMFFNDSDIESFKKDNEHIWRHVCLKTGDNKNGFWIWKPYIISLAMNRIPKDKDNIIVYCDSKYVITGDLAEKIKKHFREKDDYLFALKTHHFTNNTYLEVNYSKGDAYDLIGVEMNDSEIHHWAGFLCLRNCEDSDSFINDWLEYCRDERIVTDLPSQRPNHPRFITNRYDQTVFSLLLKKKKIALDDCDLSKILSGTPHSSLIHRID